MNPYQSPEITFEDQPVRPARGPHSGWARGLRVACLGVAGLFLLWVLGLAGSLSWFTLGSSLWVVLPYLCLYGASGLLPGSAAGIVLWLALAVCAGYGAWAFHMSYGDAQGALVLIFAPACQLAGVLASMLVAWLGTLITPPRK